MSKSACNYVFTLNNPSAGDTSRLSEILAALSTETRGEAAAGFRYLCYQYERAESGTPHFQGYCSFSDKVTIGTAARRIGGSPHVERRRGNHAQARAYATKKDTRIEGPWEAGDPPVHQGKRQDWDDLKADLDQGMKDEQVSQAHFPLYMRYHRGIGLYRSLHTSRRTSFDQLHIFWGVPGSGKSHRALSNYPSAYWIPGGRSVWFDGYSGESCIVVDEFEQQMSYGLLLRLCDKYPLKLPVKGGFVECLATTVVLTSNSDPRSWYLGNVEALLRRASITHFPFRFSPPDPVTQSVNALSTPEPNI